jgi:hypothetical protein
VRQLTRRRTPATRIRSRITTLSIVPDARDGDPPVLVRRRARASPRSVGADEEPRLAIPPSITQIWSAFTPGTQSSTTPRVLFGSSGLCVRSRREGVVPEELPTESWADEGHIARVEYRDLPPPIVLNHTPTALRTPVNLAGAVNQGYLYRSSATFARALHDTFRDRWPLECCPQVLK